MTRLDSLLSPVSHIPVLVVSSVPKIGFRRIALDYSSVVLDSQLETVEMPWHFTTLLIALVRLVLFGRLSRPFVVPIGTGYGVPYPSRHRGITVNAGCNTKDFWAL